MTCSGVIPPTNGRYRRRALTVAAAAMMTGAGLFGVPGPAEAQTACPAAAISAGLQFPQSIVQTDQGNLLVSESGDRPSNTGRISIVGLGGTRRTLLDGLPSGIGDVGDPSGPAGLLLRDHTLFALIGIGDAILNGPVPGTFTANPHPSSPILSSLLAIRFSAHVEKTTDGFTLSFKDHKALAAGKTVTLSNRGRDHITIELVANFQDYTREPLAAAPENVRGSNPFALASAGHYLYVTDGAQNQVRRVDLANGKVSTVTTFARVPNPLPIGPPFIEAVPTGITYTGERLLVTLFTGVPFAPGTSSVVRVGRTSGKVTPFITGLTTAIGILPVREHGNKDYLVLQTSSGPDPFLAGPGLLYRFDTPGAPPSVVADCLQVPTAMVLDNETDILYVTELSGTVVAIPLER